MTKREVIVWRLFILLLIIGLGFFIYVRSFIISDSKELGVVSEQVESAEVTLKKEKKLNLESENENVGVFVTEEREVELPKKIELKIRSKDFYQVSEDLEEPKNKAD